MKFGLIKNNPVKVPSKWLNLLNLYILKSYAGIQQFFGNLDGALIDLLTGGAGADGIGVLCSERDRVCEPAWRRENGLALALRPGG